MEPEIDGLEKDGKGKCFNKVWLVGISMLDFRGGVVV